MGHLALILHAHLPFVRHPEHEHFLEEEWFFEAITESYIPLLRMMQRLVDDSVPFKLTMSFTPTLCAMLEDQLLRERYVRHLDALIDLTAREQGRNRKHPQLRELADFYFALFSGNRRLFVDKWKCDLLSVVRELRDTGAVEIIASAATHGLLPILQQQAFQAARAQVLIGRDVYVDLFGAEPTGFWLPECAYAPGLEAILQETNIRWFVLDAHGLLFGNPQATADQLERVARLVRLESLIHRLPKGWEEPLGPRGNRLSGGERQRVALARALLQRPRILILDECTSALDSITERCVLSGLDEFLHDVTTILISHRSYPLQWADRVISMSYGQIIEDGSREVADVSAEGAKYNSQGQA